MGTLRVRLLGSTRGTGVRALLLLAAVTTVNRLVRGPAHPRFVVALGVSTTLQHVFLPFLGHSGGCRSLPGSQRCTVARQQCP